MKNLFICLSAIIFLVSCNNKKKETAGRDNRIYLRTDTLNVLTMKDTAVVFESVCRGCAYEQSTTFKITDSLSIIKLDGIETHDNNPPDMDGGSISKTLVIVPLKPGTTNFKLYRLESEGPVMDSIPANHHYTTYQVQVKE